MPLSLGISSAAGSLKNVAEPFALGYRVNWVGNPSFEVDLTGWTAGGSGILTRDTSEYNTGVASMKIVNSSASFAQYELVPLIAGSGTYQISAYVKLAAGNAPANYFIRQLQYETIGGGTVGSGNVGTQNLSVTGNWVRITGSITKVAIANYVAIRIVTSSTVSGEIFYVDNVMIEKSDSLGSYFDGSSGGFWSGTAHDSISGATPY